MLGESELYDEICDRLDATNDGERAGAIELALEGLYLARKVEQGVRRRGDRLRLRPTARRAPRSRYGRYAGGPDPLAPPVDLAEALDAIGEDVMAGYSPERAMREFLRRGGQDQRGLDDLARQVAGGAASCCSKHSLDGTLQEVRELLDHAVLEERKQLARDVDHGRRRPRLPRDAAGQPAAAARRPRSASSPTTTGRASEAREDYEKIKDLLGREMLDQRFAGMKQALENATDEDRAARQRDARATSTSCSTSTAAARTPTRSSPSSWTSTATSSRRTRRTSTS